MFVCLPLDRVWHGTRPHHHVPSWTYRGGQEKGEELGRWGVYTGCFRGIGTPLSPKPDRGYFYVGSKEKSEHSRFCLLSFLSFISCLNR